VKRGVGDRGTAPLPGRSGGPAPLVLYSRRYCHLCQDMLAVVEPLRLEFGLDLEVVDVDADPVLERRFNEAVPVLMHGQRELARGRLDPAVLRAYLADIG